jgi:hypothetical protein
LDSRSAISPDLTLTSRMKSSSTEYTFLYL